MNQHRQEPSLPHQGPDPYTFMRPTPPAPATEPLFRPRAKEGISPLTVGLLTATVVIGLFAVGHWAWQRGSHGKGPSPAAVVPPPAPVSTQVDVTTRTVSTPATVAANEPEPPVPGVRRCVNAVGEVSYADQPCPPGSRETLVETIEPLLSANSRGSVTLYRCKGAGTFWSQVHCQHRGAYVVGFQTVPADLSLAEQIAYAAHREGVSRPAVPPASAMGPHPRPTAAQVKASECRQLAERVAALDDYARQPLSGSEQDSVRRDRSRLRDQQFRLRC